MTVHEKRIKDIFCEAISQSRPVKFYYESESSGKKEWRTVEPYIVGIKHTGNIFLAALPVEERAKNIKERATGHYLLKKIDDNKLEVLNETYDDLKLNVIGS